MKLLLLIYERREVRHMDLAAAISSRGTLSYSLRSLLEEGLVLRRVNVDARPTRSYYSVTERGR